jgi:hypothetical protein
MRGGTAETGFVDAAGFGAGVVGDFATAAGFGATVGVGG